MDLLHDHAVVNIGAINESADPCLEETRTNNLQDSRPDTYKDRLQAHRGRIDELMEQYVEQCAGPKKNPHTKVDWVVIKNHSEPSETELEAVWKEHDKTLGYIGIKDLLEEEQFFDPCLASTDGTSYSQNLHRPTNVSKCTISAKMFLNLTYID